MSKFTHYTTARESKCRFRYWDGPDSGPFQVFAVRDDWVILLSYPVLRLKSEEEALVIPWTEDSLREALLPVMRRIHSAYGGTWILEIHAGGRDMLGDIRKRYVKMPSLRTPDYGLRRVATRAELDAIQGDELWERG